jgi:hypothetical protein
MECFYSNFHIFLPVTRLPDRHLLHSWAVSQLTFSYTLTQHSTSTLLPESERQGVTPKKVITRVSHWEVLNLPFCLLGQAWIWTQVTRDVIIHHLCNPWQWAPKKCCGMFASWDTGLWRQLAGSNIVFCQYRRSGLVSKDWAPRTKRSHLIYPCKQLTEAKSKV